MSMKSAEGPGKTLVTRRGHIALKRVLDTTAILATAPLTLPVAAVTAALVRIKMGSPIFYTQERVGIDEKTFRLLKFRSMLPETDAEGRRIPENERLTPFGHLLRRSSLDELPQLLNVLRGDMSIVGPRPLLVTYLPFYRDAERARHAVRPGITGAAQVEGRNYLGWDEQLAFDADYAREGTLLDDFKIINKTFNRVLKTSDVAVPGQEGAGWLNEDRSCLSKDGFVLRHLAERDLPGCAEWISNATPGGSTSSPVKHTVEGVERWLEGAETEPARGDYVLTDRWADQPLLAVGYRSHGTSSLPSVYVWLPSEGCREEHLGRAAEFLLEHMQLNLGLPGARVDLARDDQRGIKLWRRLGMETVTGHHSDRMCLEVRWRPQGVDSEASVAAGMRSR